MSDETLEIRRVRRKPEPTTDELIGQIREVTDALTEDIAKKTNLRDDLVRSRTEALLEGNLAWALVHTEGIAKLDGEIDGMRWARSRIQTRTRVGMEL